MTFEEQATELHRLEAVAKSYGMSERAFERIALEIHRHGIAAGLSFEEQLDRIEQRVAQARRASAKEDD